MQDTPRAKKSLGQHFLHDRHISEKIVRLLEVQPEDHVLEIGPGPGALSALLEEAGPRRLVLLEKDRHWVVERQRRAGPHTQAVLIDALTMTWERITPDCPWKIIGNLPYNVASPLMWEIFSRAEGLRRAVFMVQKEVGERLVAEPGGRDYGALSVWIQSFTRPRWGFAVGPGAFAPPPKVDSAVVTFIPLPADRRPTDPPALARLLKTCFQHRRKQLGSIFRRSELPHLAAALEQLGIDPRLRPECLSPADFQHLLTTAETRCARAAC